jgi:hypothetical protein
VWKNSIPVRRLQYRRLTGLKFDKPTDIFHAEWQLALSNEPFSEAHDLQISGQRCDYRLIGSHRGTIDRRESPMSGRKLLKLRNTDGYQKRFQ